MKKLDLNRWVPPGMELRFWKQFFCSGLFFSAFYSLNFLMEFRNEWERLWRDMPWGELWRNARMTPFFRLLDKSLLGYLIVAVGMLAMAGYSYSYFYQGSRSIYLMRRLPDRWELPRRCLALPGIGILLCVILALLNGWLYYGIYVFFTPPECLPGVLW